MRKIEIFVKTLLNDPMMIEVLVLVMSLVAIIGAILAFYFAVSAKIEIEALKKSTHTVQMVPVEQLAGQKLDDDLSMEKLAKEAQTEKPQALDWVDEL